MTVGQMSAAAKEVMDQAAAIVAPVFQDQVWTWNLVTNGWSAIPDQADIREEFERLAQACVDENLRYCASGRLRVERTEDGDLEFFLELGQVYAE